MHKEIMKFVAGVKNKTPEFFTGKRVLEVGSLIINGTIRGYFKDCDYHGIDLSEGYGVDEVCPATELLTRETPKYDVVISTESLEHDAAWKDSLHSMYELLKPNGLLIVTCAAPNRPEHGTDRVGSPEASPFTPNHYRNISVEDFASVLPANLFSKSYLGYRGNMDDLYFAGIKATTSALQCTHVCDVMLRHPVAHSCQLHQGHEGTHRHSCEVPERFVDPLATLINTPESERIFKSRTEDERTITAEISTRDRYHTLSLTLAAIINQTHKPNWIAIYDDGEQKDLTKTPPFDGLLQLANDVGINWTFFATERKGQVANHQHALDNATTDLIWRIDDDEIPEPNCLENLLAEMKDGVGAVGGLVHHPNGVMPLPEIVDGSLDDVTRGLNLAWYSWNGGPKETAHLYSTFLFSVAAARKAGGYHLNLSPVGHREETIFTHSIKRAGYKLICTPYAKTWHLRQGSGGIRSFSDGSLWQHDEQIFQEYLKTVGQSMPDTKLAILDSGCGDHLIFRALLVNEFKRKWPDRKWQLAVCYPHIFEDIDNVEIISIAEAKLIVGDKFTEYNLYDWAWRNNKTNQPVVDTMREFYAL